MAKAKPVSKYEEFEAGTYEVTEFEFFTKDNSGLPVYVVQEGRGGIRMVARYRTYDAEGNEGPPGSIEEGELALLVHAFGGDIAQLPDDKLKALAIAEQLVKAADRTVRVNVSDSGWIRNVYDMGLPEGNYVFKYSGLPRIDEDGKPAFTNTGFGQFAVTRLTVNDPGSPFNGTPQDVWINWETFVTLRALAPQLYDSLIGQPGTELKNLDSMFKAGEHKIVGEVKADERGRVRLDKSSLRPLTDDEVANETGEPSLGYIEHLYQAIADDNDKKAWRESGAFVGEGKLSQTGKAWAKEKLAPICKKEGIDKNFTNMSKDNVKTLLKELGRDDLAKLLEANDDEPW